MSSAGNPYINLAPGPASPPNGANPADYQLQLLQLQRQQRMADLLRQQAAEAIPVQSGGGAPAPISWASVLAKALNGVGAGMKERRAEDQMKQMGVEDQASAQALLAALTHKTNVLAPGTEQPTTTTVDATAPQLPGGPAPAQNSAQVQLPGAPSAAVQQVGPSSDEMLAAALAARGGPQTQMIQQALAGQALNRQNLDYEDQLKRSDITFQQGLGLSEADKERARLNLQNQEAAAQFTNNLPQNANESAQTALGYAQLNKPQFVPYGAPGYMQGGKYVPFPAGGAGTTAAAPNENSGSPSVQLGLSNGAYNLLTGNTGALGPRDKQMASRELDAFFARSGLDQSVVKPQVMAYQNNVNINTMKANALDTLAKEVVGTVQNYGPVIDKLTGGGNVRLGNQGYELVGSAVNDPAAQKAVLYLNQMRADLAGFNAVSGGKIGLHGQVGTDKGDFDVADKTIKDGLSRGGAMAVAQGIEATRQKNVAIAQQQVVEAQRGIWNALGIGARFDKTHPQAAPAKPGAGGGNRGGKAPPPPPGFVVHE